MTSVSELVWKRAPRADQLTAELDMVEDLAVEGDVDVAGRVGHRLRAAGEVDDGEAGMAETGAGFDMNAARCRARDGRARPPCARRAAETEAASLELRNIRRCRTFVAGFLRPLWGEIF